MLQVNRPIALNAVQYARRAPAQNVSTRRNGPRPERDLLRRDRDIAPRRDPRRIGPRPRRNRDLEDFVRDETLVRLETVDRDRDVSTSKPYP